MELTIIVTYKRANIKKEESRKNFPLLPPNYDLLRHNIERQKEFTGFNFRYQVEHCNTHTQMFDWENLLFMFHRISSENTPCVYFACVNVHFVFMYIRVCVCPNVIHDVPKRPSYSLVNEEKLLFSLGLIILFKHPVVSSGSCTSTYSLHMLMLTTTASNLQ